MSDTSPITLASETWRHLHEGNLREAADIWRHEGLKKGVEHAMHATASTVAGRWLIEQLAAPPVPDPLLATSIGNLSLSGPTGIAPGWDKTGNATLAWQAAGAHYVTPGAFGENRQDGNPMVRLRTFDERVGDHGTSKALNAFGFNSPGARQGRTNIDRQRAVGPVNIPVIVQATANKEYYHEDRRGELPAHIVRTVGILAPTADAISLGLSSPNTLGMRAGQTYQLLYDIIRASQDAASLVTDDELSFILKGDGDGGEERLDMYCALAHATGIHLELINTTGLAHIKVKYGASGLPGGLSGADPDYQALRDQVIRYVYENVGDKVSIIGSGGINSPEQAMAAIGAGASAVSVNTAIRTHGLRTIKNIEGGVPQLLAPGQTLAQHIGSDTNRGPKSTPTI
jgi:dihydroorotate dehydrogenase